MPEDLVGAEALLEDEHDQAPGSGDREQVQEDGLERQDQRAERAREEDEREDGDQRDHQREVAVDGVEEVGALRCLATDRHLAGRGVGAEAVERLSAGRGVPVFGRDDRDERRPVAAPVCGRCRALDTLDFGERLRDGVGVARADERVEGRERAGADARVLQLRRGRHVRALPVRATRRAGSRAGSSRRRRRARPARRSRSRPRSSGGARISARPGRPAAAGAGVAVGCEASRASGRSSPGRPEAA